MGLESWFKELGVAKKSCVVIASGVALCATGYGLYRAYNYVQDVHSKGKEQGEEEEGKAAKRVLLLGLDGSGKSAFLAALSQQGNQNVQREETRPTEGFNVVSLTTDGMALNMWEVGGAEKFRSFWPNFTANTDVFVYLVDAGDTSRLRESKEALGRILEDGNLKDVPLVLIVSKQDTPDAKSAEEVAKVFEVESGLSPSRLVGVVATQITENGQDEGLSHAKEMILGLCKD